MDIGPEAWTDAIPKKQPGDGRHPVRINIERDPHVGAAPVCREWTECETGQWWKLYE